PLHDANAPKVARMDAFASCGERWASKDDANAPKSADLDALVEGGTQEGPHTVSVRALLQSGLLGEAVSLRRSSVAEVHVGLDLRVASVARLVELLGRGLALDLEALR